VAKRPRRPRRPPRRVPWGSGGGPVRNAKKCENGPENDRKTRHISKGISYMFPHILQAQNDPPILIYTPPGGGIFDRFGGLAGCPRGLAGPDRPSGNLNQKVPHFGAGWARSGPESALQLARISRFPSFWGSMDPDFPDFSIFKVHISGFLDLPLPDFRISRFSTPIF